jgi:predicted O-methyltransferase YrrM
MRLAARAKRLFFCCQGVRHFRSISLSDMTTFCLNTFRVSQVPEELMQLTNIVARLRPRHVLEIGTAHGGTLWLWCRLSRPDATLVSVDLPHGQFGGGYHWARIPLYWRFAGEKQTVRLIRGDSHSSATLELINRRFPQGIDFLFIDGDHSYAGARQDFEMYSPVVKRGGIIAFHDIASHRDKTCEVSLAWNEIKSRYRSEDIIEDSEQGWAGIGVLYTA